MSKIFEEEPDIISHKMEDAGILKLHGRGLPY
jgi:hypothetical protein